jgi:DNA-binding transcriptional ArsR family regulator
MLAALIDGRALSASELASAARVTPQTASTHLAKLTEAGVLSAVRAGRHRHFRLASAAVVEMIEGIAAVALEKRPRYLPLSREARALNAARICYDHLAGRLSVDLTDALVVRGHLVLDGTAAEMTAVGVRVLTTFGIDAPPRRSTRRGACRPCLDWTERRPHIAGPVGAALTKRYFDLGWMERAKGSQAVLVTASGRRGLKKTFGVDVSDPR